MSLTTTQKILLKKIFGLHSWNSTYSLESKIIESGNLYSFVFMFFPFCRTDFDWLKMLRYYWVEDTETMEAKMASACLPYFYEYLGAGGVLVITPLTDRCYLCLMGALQMDLGGAPAGI